ncbi:carboxypeptidase-like regulatory domain-containing protein [Polaribacter sp. NJDZ03]|uniref:carboxypeptidase-like regulatory domain-containing protein n=1 Tax=Polaribacter sp. NJDZ03 TaxID=2855841 RepID=UPI001C49D0D5|nr:carboxypeptidase-like regulatory domain-containing protein [Polaribacter sp. NJDZ03]
MKYFLLIIASAMLFYPLENKIKPEIIFGSKSVEFRKEKDSLIIYGNIKDNVGDSFKYVNVNIQNSNLKIKVNENGDYKVNVFDLLNKKDELIIQFSFLGFKTEKRNVKKELFNRNNILEINIKMKEEITIIECPNG